MPSSLSTANRMYFLTLPECEMDEVLIEEMTGHEAMSQLFEFRLRLISESEEVDPRKIIGKPAILRIEGESMDHMDGERHWNGVVSRFQRTGRLPSADGEDLYSYECDIVPWFWFMTQHEDCRIFQNKTVRQIIEIIFDEFGYQDFRFDISETHPTLEYCTQFHETTFAFISRLLERDGIHYYFRHHEVAGETRHILFFADNNRGNPALDPAVIPFHHAGHAEEGLDAITTLTLDQQMRTRKVSLSDWDFLQKRALLEDTPTMLRIGEDRDLERYRYPGQFVDPALGIYRSRVIMEAEESSHMRFRGDSQIRTLTPGHTFTLEDHPFDEFNIEYMVLSVWHHGRNNLTNDSGPSDYGNNFNLQPHAVTWRAPLATPRSRVFGPQTALVTGPPGEEIHTDQHGRIKVRFHWDRIVPGRSTNTADDQSSCWIRVAQMWAGNGYGTMFIPRIGMEVVVDFLDGDPDQPIVTGCVYNGVNKTPYALPAEATKSTIKTLSSKGGGGTNELRFEDKKGSEEVFLQAEKALQVNVKGSKTEFVGYNYDLSVHNYLTVAVDQMMWLSTKDQLVIHSDTLAVLESETLNLRSSQNFRCDAQQQLELAAMDDITVHSLGGNISLVAANTISLRAGPSFITLGASGISIVGPTVNINSGGSPLPGGSLQGGQAFTDANKAHGTDDGTVTDPVQQLQAQALINGAISASPFCAECEAARAAYQALMA